MVDLCHEYRNKGVVGLDVAGNEGNGILESFNEATGESLLDSEIIKTFKVTHCHDYDWNDEKKLS